MNDIALDPNAPNMTAEQAWERLQTWFQKKQQLKTLKDHEYLERGTLAEYYFPRPVEGTNRLELGGGFDLKLTHSYNRAVDEELVSQVKAADIKRLKLPWDDLIEYKPSLKIGVYNKLSTEQKAFVDGLLTIKPGSPQLDVVPSVGADVHNAAQVQQEPADAPAAATQPEPYSINTGKSEDTEEGQYWFDGETWWLLDSEMEWQEVDADVAAALTAQLEASKPKRGRKPRAAKS